LTGFWSTETMRARLSDEDLITPYDPDLIESCAYELRLGSEVYVTGEQSKTKRILETGEQVRIPPGQFANLLTEETVHIPADALGFLSARFKWKQRGLVNVSGFHVDPGYTGKILFSVFNAGPTPVVVARGDRLFLLWYSSLDQETEDKYRGPERTGITSEDVAHLQGEVATPQALATRVEALEQIVKVANPQALATRVDALELIVKVAKWVIVVVVGAIIATLIGLGLTAAISGGEDSGTTTESTTTTVPAPAIVPDGAPTQPPPSPTPADL